MVAAGGGPGPEDVPLDADLLKVLAADTRRDILRLLQKRRMTLTELAAALDLKKATVLEHLKRLLDAGLVRRLEDERLWVYYELTREGGRLLNPGRTRFYLVMAAAAAAALLLGGVATVALLDAEATDLAVALRTEPVAGGIPVSFEARLDADPAGLRAWLLTPEQAPLLGGDAPPGTPLAATPLPDGGVRLASRSPLPPGDYLLYVRAEAGDNRDRLVPVHLPRYEADGPAAATVGLDGPLRFDVTRDGRPAEGRLLLVRDGTTAAALPLDASGAAHLDAAALDALPAGAYRLAAQPRGADDVTVPLGREVAIRAVPLVLQPLHVAEGRALPLNVSLPGHAGGAPEVRVGGAPVPVEGADGRYRASLPALAPGEVDVQVGRLRATLLVHADPRLSLAPRDGGLELRVADRDGAPLAGVQASLDEALLGETDADGRLSFAPPADAGPATLRLRAPQGALAERTLLFDEGGVREAFARLRVVDLRQDAGNASARVANEGEAPADATVSARVDDVLVASERVRVEPGATATLRFHAPAGGRVEVVAEPLRLAPIALEAGPPPAPVEDARLVQPWVVMTPTATTPAPTAPTAVSPSFAPAPEVPLPWMLAPLAAAGAALLLRRRQ